MDTSTTLSILAGEYLKALGTPYPVGATVCCNDRTEMIVKYDFDLSEGGLVALTDYSTRLSDYHQLADGERRALIRRFFEAGSSKRPLAS